MKEKAVLFVKGSKADDFVKELGEDFDFEGNGILMRTLSDEDFDEYVESVHEWESNNKDE